MVGPTSQKGFSLLELLISMTIIGLLMVAVLRGFGQSIASTGKLRYSTVAMNLARERLEFLKQYENRARANFIGYHRDSNVWTDGSPSTRTQNGKTFTVTTSLISNSELQPAYRNSASTKYVVPVRVTVSWTENSATRSVDLETFYYQTYN